MKLTSSSTARRRTANAVFRSFGGPQMPSPVRRIAPKPRRCTESSPPSETSPAKLAESSFLFMTTSKIVPLPSSHADCPHLLAHLEFVVLLAKPLRVGVCAIELVTCFV